MAIPSVTDSRPLNRWRRFSYGLDVYLSFDGRLNRKAAWTHYGIAMFSVMVASLAVIALGTAVGFVLPGVWQSLVLIGFLPVVVFMMWASVAIWVRRFHDLNRSGWWYVLTMVAAGVGRGINENSNDALVVFALLAWCVWFPLWLYMGFIKGTRGPNRYGPDPLDSAAVSEVPS
jgi:uncharacterized membrane protein YhaH (DUF805 family)